MALGVDSASNRNEYQDYSLGVKSGRCVRLTTYHHPMPLSRNLGTLTSWNPLGLFRSVTGLIYILHSSKSQPEWGHNNMAFLKNGMTGGGGGGAVRNVVWEIF